MKQIVLSQGKMARVDDEDYDCLCRHKWCAQKRRNGNWYAIRNSSYKSGKRTTIQMHREILKPPANRETDHKDGDSLNNQRDNLRAATHTQNMHNQKPQKGTTSRFKGVSWRRDIAKWQASIKVKRKQLHLGFFLSEIAAAKAYDRAARKYFGEFARTNFKNLKEYIP